MIIILISVTMTLLFSLSERWKQTIELVGKECGLLSRVGQKCVSTKWRIYRATELAQRRFVGKAQPFFVLKLTRTCLLHKETY